MISRNNLILVLLSFSLLAPTTFGIFGSYAVILMFISYVIAFFIRGGFFAKNDIFVQGGVFIFLLFLFSLSYINEGGWVFIIGKTVHTWILFLFVSIKYPITVNYSKLIKIFLIYSVLIFSIVSFFGEPGVMFRFTGYSFDPNYFGMSCLSLYMPLYLFDNYKKSSSLKLIMAFTIFLTGSMSVVSLLVLFHIILLLKIRFSKVVIVVAIFGSFLVYVVFIFNIGSFIEGFDSDGSLYWQYKLASFGQRLDVQIRCLDMLFSNINYILYGVGSGRTNEYLGKALHNGFLQMVFSHGVGFLLVVVFFIVGAYSSLQDKFSLSRDKNVVFAGFMIFIISNYSLDTLLTGSFISFILIVKIYQQAEFRNFKQSSRM